MLKIKNYLLLLMFLCTFCVISSNKINAQEITVINAGSKAGVTFIESQNISEILQKHYTVNFINPGNSCVAMSTIKKIKGPVIFIWDSTYEASARSLENSECSIKFDAETVMRVDTLDWRLCSFDQADRKSLVKSGNSFKIGHANPRSLFVETVELINKAFSTTHRPVHYSEGLSHLVTALQNKEIDYALLSAKFANKMQTQGLSCQWTLDNNDRGSLPSLAKISRAKDDIDLTRIYQVLLVGKNFDTASWTHVRDIIKNQQQTAGTSLNKLYELSDTSNWKINDQDAESLWELSVKVNIVK